MRTPIPLPSAEKLRASFSYDPDTGVLYRNPKEGMRKTWETQWAGKPCGHRTPRGYLQVFYEGKSYLAHRIIWKIVYGFDPIEVDHIDGDTTNNKKENLRNVMIIENVRNSGVRNGKSFPLGVFLNKRTGRIYAKFCGNGINKHLGTFDSAEDAARAYDAHARAEYGEYARLNYPEEVK